jgi:hypothetical protein
VLDPSLTFVGQADGHNTAYSLLEHRAPIE